MKIKMENHYYYMQIKVNGKPLSEYIKYTSLIKDCNLFLNMTSSVGL